ncbi:Major facilitator superfamily domain containing protein [Tylopilus felleus]
MNDLTELKEEKLSQAERAALDSIVWRKLDARVLPLCTGFFLLATVDRTNIANARVAGLQTSLAMSNHQFALALTVAYAPYIASQFPSALLLKYVGPDLMLPTMVALLGVASAIQGLVNNYPELLACRLFLAFVEGGIVPCIVLYLSCFYPRERLQIRIAAFSATASLAIAFSGLLAAAIDWLHGKGGKPGWAWIFILEGLFTFIFGVISFSLLPRSPETIRFLTEKERVHVVSTLKYAGSVSEDDNKDSFSWAEVGRGAKSLHVWLLVINAFLNSAILFGLASFEPTIVAGLGHRGSQALFMSVPPFAAAFFVSIISAIVSDRYQCRGYTIIFFSLVEMIGFAMFHASTSSHVRYVSLFFSVIGGSCVMPVVHTWLANNSAPHTRRATTVALNSIAGELGGLLATWLLGSVSPGPNYTSATLTFIVMSIGIAVFSSANLAYLRQQNRLKAERRQRMRKEEEPEGLGDRSAWFIYSL